MGACEERVRSDENLKACSTAHSNMLWMKSCHVPETTWNWIRISYKSTSGEAE